MRDQLVYCASIIAFRASCVFGSLIIGCRNRTRHYSDREFILDLAFSDPLGFLAGHW
jgi:hypothetical protein